MALSIGEETNNDSSKVDQEKNGRKLRSKDVSTSKKTLFDFDNLNRLLYRNERVVVSGVTDFDNLYSYNQEIGLPPQNLTNKLTEITLVDEVEVELEDDVLEDETYELFHKKMKKEEKVMANEDKLRILSEVDNLQTQLQLLKQYDWVRHLPQICHINDTRDIDELESKKELTIIEIEKLLRKYDSWKRRSDQLVNDMKNDIADLVDPVEEYDLPLETIKLNRKMEIRQRFGPTIKLKLNNGFMLVIDPVLPPKVVKSGKSDYAWKPSPIKVSSPIKSKVVKPTRVQPKPRTIHLEEVESIDLMTRSTGDLIFGTKITNLKVPQDGFQLPKFMKTESLTDEQERASFRKSLTQPYVGSPSVA